MTEMTEVEYLKIQLYDTIEQQAVLQAEFNRLETMKGVLAKKLGEARKREQDAAKGND